MSCITGETGYSLSWFHFPFRGTDALLALSYAAFGESGYRKSLKCVHSPFVVVIVASSICWVFFTRSLDSYKCFLVCGFQDLLDHTWKELELVLEPLQGPTDLVPEAWVGQTSLRALDMWSQIPRFSQWHFCLNGRPIAVVGRGPWQGMPHLLVLMT